MDAMPDAQWRVLWALARFGGLRSPSESRLLRWTDVNWAANKLLVRTPKTEHHGEGHDYKHVPLFPELRRELDALWEQTPKGTIYVLPRWRSEKSLAPHISKILDRNGIPPIKTILAYARRSRAMELRRQYPEAMVARWMGHSVKIADEHYDGDMDRDFEVASQRSTTSDVDRKFANNVPASAGTKLPANDDMLQNKAPSDLQEASINTSVAEAGLEPARPLRTRDFKSRASANSATRPSC